MAGMTSFLLTVMYRAANLMVQHRTERRDLGKLVEASRLPVGIIRQVASTVLQEQY